MAMISHLKGIVMHTGNRFVIIDVNGVGYKLFVTAETVELLRDRKEPTNIWTYLSVRENALDLYGFPEKAELDFFELLITVSGIGPKTALGVLNVTTTRNLRQAISSGDSANLTKVSGIGRKVAEKIVLELRDKIDLEENEKESGSMRDESDALEGLKALGYNEREAREVLKKIPKEISTPSDRIKQALKILGK